MRCVGYLLVATACSGGPASQGGDAGDASADVADVTQEPLDPTVAKLMALTAGCTNDLGGPYTAKDGSNQDVCGLNGAVYWKAGMNIDCDGITTTTCNPSTDPAYQAQTSCTDQVTQAYLDASLVPYIVIPLPSTTRWDYTTAGIQLGQVVLVMYQGKYAFGVFGDQGPNNLIGEASVAMAKLFGIDPDPATGGADTGVTYVVFTGPTAVDPNCGDHAQAVAMGPGLLQQLLANN